MIVVFAGPSLSAEQLDRYSGIAFRPPVKQGDLYCAALEGPRAIAIIDGVFDGVPSVWHKEILWALSRGIPVLGAASMGALRAAELDVFGMTGIGHIYEAYRDGVLEDDDEVALQHGPAEAGYTPLSLAMVNIRATLERAVGEGRLSRDQGQRAADLIKAIHFKARDWNAVVSAVSKIPDAFAQGLGAWLRDNYVDQKNRDAIALLEHLNDAEFQLDRPVGFHFEHTELWRRGVSEWRQRPQAAGAMRDNAFRLVPQERLFRSAGDDD
ncbi:TfuA-like protein [Hoeflea sp.]|uniref:TfuA-like protein n=1 Tax=Hoeflea sp. TaxID=1940281 RepID=UPI003B0101F8